MRALIVAPGEPERLVPVINEAESKGIRVICVDSDVAASSRSTVVSVDAEVSGKVAAELMARFLDPGAQVAIVTGTRDVELQHKKATGFCEVFPQLSPGGEIVEIVDTSDNEDDAMCKCFALLERWKSLSGIYIRTGNCLPICRALNVLGLSGKIQVVATDLFGEMVPYFENGVIQASVNGRPYAQGQIAMRLLVDHFIRGHSLPPHYRLNLQIVLRSNLHLFREVKRKGEVQELIA